MESQRWECQYTKQKTKKVKTWQDGFLELFPNRKCTVRDRATGGLVDSMYLPPSITINSGEEVDFETCLARVDDTSVSTTPLAPAADSSTAPPQQPPVAAHAANHAYPQSRMPESRFSVSPSAGLSHRSPSFENNPPPTPPQLPRDPYVQPLAPAYNVQSVGITSTRAFQPTSPLADGRDAALLTSLPPLPSSIPMIPADHVRTDAEVLAILRAHFGAA
ncbi:hypothetical protein PAPYR_4072 [Paratrimastix pyriformis]|uniref:5'-3' DNA helicase ZGRF1-like N-terminal domain-containing protein n=1 Tax=Paratrimastix pyriformis TaxID=342808 RepID=A0ABQ8UQK6_9EUKA|nr:hypothetical protein PAPYR_4072 [Paratrimastix pyriformis]